ncbi:MAG: hypothetical protein C0592_12215 [Marinilabiliales bacterium]|nr:MAG: hypothetical protein C0592_12215 [Marinilabiliales bacterium]
MRIRYSLDATDYLKFQLFIASRSRQVKRRRAFARWFIPVLYILVGVVIFGFDHLVAMIVFSAVAVLWAIFYPFYCRNRYVRYYRRFIEEHYSDNFNKDFFIETRDDGFYLEAEEANSNVKYSAVKNIFNLASHYLIQLNPGTVVILPVDKTEQDQLEALIKEISDQSKKIVLDCRKWKWK